MNMHQAVHPGSSSNEYIHRKIERDVATRFDNKFQAGKTNSSRSTGLGNGGEPESPSRDRLIYLTTCLIGHQVEVQVLDGSVFSGIFHSTNADEDFGIILNMAHLVKDGSQEHNNISDSVSIPPSRTLIVPAKELVQVVAKGVSVTRDGLTNELLNAKQQELMIDACISQSRCIEVERELEPWVPDEDDPGCPELENIFDNTWNRDWDQFEANETLFGVKTTFNEEFYTTKLEKGPQKGLEREAMRIAREIEVEETCDLHLAEERGLQLNKQFEIDEETRFSSVCRGVDDSGCDEIEDILLDSRNEGTYGGVSRSAIRKPFTNLNTGRISDEAEVSLRSLSMDEVKFSQTSTSREMYHSASDDHVRQLTAEQLCKSSSATDARIQENQFIGHADSSYAEEDTEKQALPDQSCASKTMDLCSSLTPRKESSDKAVLSHEATTYDPSHVSTKGQVKESSCNELSEGAVPSKTQGTSTSLAWPSSSALSSYCGGATSISAGHGLLPSSFVGSLSSDKSTLNPHAKEFKLNPNAQSFIPSQTPLRPASPVPDSSFYYRANMAALPQVHGMPVSIGIGPSFTAQLAVIFNPQVAPMPQTYFHPNGPQYGPQMITGLPGQVMYMPTYPPEMPYKGRDF